MAVSLTVNGDERSLNIEGDTPLCGYCVMSWGSRALNSVAVPAFAAHARCT